MAGIYAFYTNHFIIYCCFYHISVLFLPKKIKIFQIIEA